MSVPEHVYLEGGIFFGFLSLFSFLEHRWPYAPTNRRVQLGLDLLGASVGLLAVALTRSLELVFDPRSMQLQIARNLDGLPMFLRVLLMLVSIDFCLYWIHRAMHTSWLWRAHVLHHTAESLHWLSGLRTSMVHAALFTVPQLLIPLLLGATPVEAALAVGGVIFAQFFVHADLNIWLGPVGRWLLVTPSVHRLHHSVSLSVDRNFGSVFIFWDRIFGTWHLPEVIPDHYPLGVGPESARVAKSRRALAGV